MTRSGAPWANTGEVASGAGEAGADLAENGRASNSANAARTSQAKRLI